MASNRSEMIKRAKQGSFKPGDIYSVYDASGRNLFYRILAENNGEIVYIIEEYNTAEDRLIPQTRRASKAELASQLSRFYQGKREILTPAIRDVLDLLITSNLTINKKGASQKVPTDSQELRAYISANYTISEKDRKFDDIKKAIRRGVVEFYFNGKIDLLYSSLLQMNSFLLHDAAYVKMPLVDSQQALSRVDDAQLREIRQSFVQSFAPTQKEIINSRDDDQFNGLSFREVLKYNPRYNNPTKAILALLDVYEDEREKKQENSEPKQRREIGRMPRK